MRQPPERFHVFVSYTTREEEVQSIKPIVDSFLNNLLRPLIEQTIREPPAFYDGYSLYRHGLSNCQLKQAIAFAM